MFTRVNTNLKPPGRPTAAYRNSTAWAQEVQAVIAAAGLKRPVLVGWSYAGRVISDYLATEGAGKITGVNFVDAPIKVIRHSSETI